MNTLPELNKDQIITFIKTNIIINNNQTKNKIAELIYNQFLLKNIIYNTFSLIKNKNNKTGFCSKFNGNFKKLMCFSSSIFSTSAKPSLENEIKEFEELSNLNNKAYKEHYISNLKKLVNGYNLILLGASSNQSAGAKKKTTTSKNKVSKSKKDTK